MNSLEALRDKLNSNISWIADNATPADVLLAATAAGVVISAYRATKGYRTPTNALLALAATAGAVATTVLATVTTRCVLSGVLIPLAVPFGTWTYALGKATQHTWNQIEKEDSKEQKLIEKATQLLGAHIPAVPHPINP